jgi:hypothetical protein
MRRHALVFFMMALAPALGWAAEQDDFLLKSGQDLVEVCTVAPEDPLYSAAIHFCHGYMTGLGDYHRELRDDPSVDQIICPTGPTPSRNDVIDGYVAWAESNPQHLSEPAIDTVFRYAMARWPCSSSS